MSFLDRPDYIVDQSLLASFNGPWIDVGDYNTVEFHAEWTAVAATDGTLSIEGTLDKASINPQPLTIGTFHGAWPTVGVTADKTIVIIEKPPRFVRLVYTRVAGGALAQFLCRVFAKAVGG